MSISLNDTSTSIWTDNTTTNKTYPYTIEEAWSYDTGTNEAALLNNIKHPEQETIGKIYYIQAYFNDNITQNVPYMVIGVNHDGTTNTVDLMSKVIARSVAWNSSYTSWSNGKYTTSSFYSWLPNTCPSGYSSSIQSKMVNMTERWREATGNATGTLQTRQTKCKILNPVELWGYSSATFSQSWQYASTSDYKTDFASPTGDKYGTLYPAWTNSTGGNTNRRVFSNLTMTSGSYYWTNSWLAFYSQWYNAFCFIVKSSGQVDTNYVANAYGVAPVIRLSN